MRHATHATAEPAGEDKQVTADRSTAERWLLAVFVALQVSVPLVVLAWRLLDAPVPFYGWGWEMFT